MRAFSDPHQLRLFGELIESRLTAVELSKESDGGWRSVPTRPAGKGWQIADHRQGRKTLWLRRQPIILRPRAASRGGGGWRR